MKKPLNLLIVAMKHSYGDPNMGLSYEWNHFYLGLKQAFSNVRFFDFMTHYHTLGKAGMQQQLCEQVADDMPQVILFVPYTDQFDVDCIESLRKKSKVLCFFHDDGWRETFVKSWAPHVDAFTSSDIDAVKKYHAMGFEHVVSVPFGVNEHLFRLDKAKSRDIDVSFIGAWHPYREWLIRQLEKSGINVKAAGYRWSDGVLATEAMVDIFQRSKISLTLSNSVHYTPAYLLSSPRAVVNAFRSKKRGEQIKGRHFEVPACGALQLSFAVKGLEQMFVPDQEIVLYHSVSELKDKVRYYLQKDAERERIALAGYNRVLSDHTYAARFLNVFSQLGWIS